MVFENIKKYLEERKEKRKHFFALEYEEKQGAVYIVEQKILEIMLVNDWDFFALKKGDFIKSEGWDFGKGNKIYEKFNLNEKGNWLYEYNNTKAFGLTYLEALYEMNSGIRLWHFKREKQKIENNLKRNKLIKISGYSMVKNNERDEQKKEVVNKR